MPIRLAEPDLVGPLTQLARMAASGCTVDDILSGLCRAAVSVVNVDAASALKVDVDESGGCHGLWVVHAEPSTSADDSLLAELPPGPVRNRILAQSSLLVDEVADLGQWHGLAPVATPRRGPVLLLTLRVRGRTHGVLELHRAAPRPFQPRELALATVLADVAAPYVALAFEHEQSRSAWRELEHQATHDRLTGLPRGPLLVDRLQHALANARQHDTVLAVLMMNVDRLQEVNDSYGHVAGNEVLIQVVRRLRAGLRDSDTLARLPGDEFLAVIENVGGAPDVTHARLQALRTRIYDVLEPPLAIGGRALAMSVSIGAAVTSGEGSARDLIRRADEAMYEARRGGTGIAAAGTETGGQGEGQLEQLI